MMNENGQLTFMDILSILSFMISCKNLDLNISAEDIARSAHEINEQGDKRIEKVLAEIHGHLSVQDSKLNLIMEQLEDLRNGSK
jgi:hypothetical protein